MKQKSVEEDMTTAAKDFEELAKRTKEFSEFVKYAVSDKELAKVIGERASGLLEGAMKLSIKHSKVLQHLTVEQLEEAIRLKDLIKN